LLHISYHVYIPRCSDGSYYVGHTDDLETRVRRHNDGCGPAYARARRPVMLAYSERHATEASAVAREGQLKHWSRTKKKALVSGRKALLRQLSQSRD